MPIDFDILITSNMLEIKYITAGSELPNDYLSKKQQSILDVLEINDLFPNEMKFTWERMLKNGEEKGVY